MTQIIDTEVVESSARYLTFRLKRPGGKLAFDASSALRVWFGASHDDTGAVITVDVPPVGPSDFASGKVVVRVTRADLFQHLGKWQYHLSALIGGEDVPLAIGSINILDRAADPVVIAGGGALRAEASITT